MWLQPAVRLIATAAARTYYRLEVAGPAVPESGPVLLVANHPNGLLDPALVIAAARRRVRFLAKSTLFSDLRLGWLVHTAQSEIAERLDGLYQSWRRGEIAAGPALGSLPRSGDRSDS